MGLTKPLLTGMIILVDLDGSKFPSGRDGQVLRSQCRRDEFHLSEHQVGAAAAFLDPRKG